MPYPFYPWGANVYPYTNYHQINLDWILETVKRLCVEWAATVKDWEELKKKIDDFLSGLDIQKEVSDKIEEMASSGELEDIINKELFNDMSSNNIVWETVFTNKIPTNGTDDCTDIFNSLTKGVGLRPGVYKVFGDVTFQVPVFFSANAIIDMAPEASVTFNKGIFAGKYKIINNANSNVKINGVSIYPEWFGAVNDGVTDCYDAFKNAIYAITNTGSIELENGNQGEYSEEDNTWKPLKNYYISQTINFNRPFSSMRASAYAAIYCPNPTVCIIGQQDTSQTTRLERITFENILFISGADNSSRNLESPDSYCVRVQFCEGLKMRRCRVIGNPNGFYLYGNIGCNFEGTGVTGAVKNTQFRGWFLDNSLHNWSTFLTNCGVSQTSDGDSNSYGFYASGNDSADLTLESCEFIGTPIGIHWDGATTGIDVRFSKVVVDQCKKAVELVINKARSDIHFDTCYFQRPSNTLKLPMIDIQGAAVSSIVTFIGCEFHDGCLTDPTIQHTRPVTINACEFYTGYAIASSSALMLSNSTFIHYQDTPISCFVEVKTGSTNMISGCSFNSASGNSSTENGALYVSGATAACNMIGCAYSGAGIDSLMRSNAKSNLVINAQNITRNKYPGM